MWRTTHITVSKPSRRRQNRKVGVISRAARSSSATTGSCPATLDCVLTGARILRMIRQQSQTYDREGVSLACFSLHFGGLVLGCIDSYDSNQILILQRFSRSTRFTFLRTAPYSTFSIVLSFFVVFHKIWNFGILSIFVLIWMNFSRNFTTFSRIRQNLKK